LFLYKILNDSILNGTKGIWDSADDYELVDRVQWDSSEDSINGYGYIDNGTLVYRKSYVQEGTTVMYEGFDADPDSCDWYNYSRNKWAGDNKLANSQLGNYIGSHTMDAITDYSSTVTSDVYSVDLGYEGDLSIVGEVTSHTVEVFISNLNKADSLQTITVTTSTGVAKDSADLMVDGDIVVVVSADEVNSTSYTVENRALSSNTDLEEVDDMGIEVDNSALTVSGFDYTTAIADVLAGVTTADDLSVINVIDSTDNLVSLLTLSKDTTLDESYVDTKVYNGVQFEVVAEDGSIAKYTLVPDASSSDAYITSNVFTVDEGTTYKSITGVSYGYSVSVFLNYLIPSGNATMQLMNKVGTERLSGLLHYDDYVKVTSEDSTTVAVYAINFYEETDFDQVTKIDEVQEDMTDVFSAYPNPTSSKLNLNNVQVGSVIQIIALNGSMVYTTIADYETLTIDMSSLDRGVYFVRCVYQNASSAIKVIKL
jgi:hypothetical protein